MTAISEALSDEIARLTKKLRTKTERVHDLSGVGYNDDADCHRAADLLELLAQSLRSGNGGEVVAERVYQAVLSCSHRITHDEVRLFHDQKPQGKNALAQLHDRIKAALSTPPVGAETGEPVAWRWQTNYTDDTWHYAEKVSFAPRDIELGIVKNITPLFDAPSSTSPAVPNTVTADMIERAQKGYRKAGEKRNWQASWPDDDAMHEILTAALGQEAGE